MANGISHPSTGSETKVHYSDRFPVVRTACGVLGPSTNEWQYVSCPDCKMKKPKQPWRPPGR